MKIFLSQAEVPWAWALKQGLGNPYKLHQWIWNVLPNDPNANRDFLFRSDVKNSFLKILLLSERIPLPSEEVQWKTTEMSGTFLGYGAYRFQLRANPTFRRAFDHKRLAIFDEVKIREWFTRKFTDAGCDVQGLETTAPRKLQFLKGSGLRQGTVYSVDASGILVVRNESQFRAAFETGIGPAKGFGFGLLLLQPIQL